MVANVALIGLTHPHSRMYLDTLDALDEVGAVALCDPDGDVAHEIAQRYRKAAGVYTELAPLLAQPGITHALVAVPNQRSVATLLRVIEAGKPVFTEKPAARTASEFLPVLDALSRRRVAFTIAYLNRWHPALRQLREWYRAGALGRLTSVELRMVTTQVRLRDPRHWLFQREVAGGGILSWLGCHWLDLVRYITGEEFTQVSAQLATTSGEAIDVEDTAAVAFRLSGGAVGSLHAGYLLTSGVPGYEGTSYDMAVHLRGTLGNAAYHRGAGDEPLQLESSAPPWRNASPQALHFTIPKARGYGGLAGLDFFRAFLTAGPGDTAPAGAVDALRVLEILDAIYTAGPTGATIELAPHPV